MRCSNRNREGGFTLIELMVVITIIGLLVTFGTVKYMDFIDEGRVAKAKADITTLKDAMRHYRRKKGSYPSTSDGLEAVREEMEDEAIPTDPWGNPYVYKLVDSRHFVITSYGADGLEGGEGIDADIESDKLTEDKDDI